MLEKEKTNFEKTIVVGIVTQNQNEEKLLAQGVNPYSGLNTRAYNLNFNPDGLRTSSDMQDLMNKYNVGTF